MTAATTPSQHSNTLQPATATQPELLDIHLPQSPSFWPPAPGWWVLALVLLLFILLSLFKYRAMRRRRRKIHRITQLLAPLMERLHKQRDIDTVAELNTLLRQLALLRYPRSDIASLTGKYWLEFLDRSGKTSGFSQGAGKLLADLPYRPHTASHDTIPKADAKALGKLVKHWLKHSGVLA